MRARRRAYARDPRRDDARRTHGDAGDHSSRSRRSLSRHHISGAPVLAGHSVVGVVSATDLLEFVASNDGLRSPTDDRPSVENTERMRAEYDDEASSLVFTDWLPEIEMDDAEPFVMDNTLPTDLFGEHTVSEVMTCEICSLPPQALVTEAARYMWKAGVHRLLILDKGGLRESSRCRTSLAPSRGER